MTTDTRHYPVVMVTDPRHYLAIKPMPKAVNHVGLKITSRSLNPNYTCELPQRKEVAKKNFSRRKYQISQCGYHSSICAPYNEVGHVVLDSKNLILKTLGQKEKEPETTPNDLEDEDNINPSLTEDEDDEDTIGISKNNTKNLRTVEKHLSRSVKVMKEVKLGRSLFDLIDKEKQQMQKEIFLKKSREIREKQMRVLSAGTNGEECDDSDNEFIIRTPSQMFDMKDEKTAPCGRRKRHLSLSIDQRSANRTIISPEKASKIVVGNTYHGRKRKENLPRPYSPVFNNLNFYRATSRDALFRQLCAVNWILEAMSQDNNPPVMSSISTCWNLRDLKDNPKLLQKRIERDKVADPIWQAFLANPSKFQSKGQRRLHIPPTSKSGGSYKSNNPTKFPDRASAHSDEQSSQHASESHRNHESSEVSKNIQQPVETMKSFDMEGSKERNKSEHIHWHKIKESLSSEPMLADVVVKMKEKASDELQHVPNKMKGGFSDVKTEQAIILHDNLEAKERNRWKNYEKKFLSMKIMNNMYETLKTFRQQEKENKDDTEEDKDEKMAKDTVCLWYLEMMQMLPYPMKEDSNIALVLKKLKRFCDLEGRKTSRSHFVRALSILRPFELCYPDVSAAIEFVRDRIVRMDKKEFEAWCKRHTKHLLRSQSAPPLVQP